jgi:predicted esterase
MPFATWRPPDAQGPLATLYLVHGVGRNDNEQTWLNPQGGNASAILAPLIANGAIPPLNVVSIFAWPLGIRPDGDRPPFPLLDAFVPYLNTMVGQHEADANQVRPGPGARAIAGLSMGGWLAIGAALHRPQLFTALGNFSGALQGQVFNVEGLRRVPVLYTTCGQQDAGCLPLNEAFRNRLRDANIPHSFDFVAGAHDWAFWRGALGRFALQLGASAWGR